MNLTHLIGFWNGTNPTKNAFLHYTELDIFQPKEDEPTLYLRYRSSTYKDCPEVKIQWQDSRTFVCTVPFDLMREGYQLQGRYNKDQRVLQITFEGAIFDLQNYTVQLRRNDSSCIKYQRAAETLDYEYRVPVKHGKADYYQPGDASAHGLNTNDISSLIKKLMKLNSGAKNDAQVDGILILKDEKLVLEEYFWGLGPDDYHQISSCTKSVVSLLFGIAWDQGLIDLEEPVANVFPEIQSDWADGNPILLKHILSMTSGSVNDLGDSGLDENLLRSDEMAKMILSVKRIEEPGAVYSYDNKLPFLAGLILERKIGENVESFAKKHLFTPLAIHDPHWTYMEKQKSIDGTRFPFTSGAMMLPLRQFAKIGQLVLNHGEFGGKQIVSKEWLEQSTLQHTIKGQWPYGFYWHLSTPDQRHLGDFNGIMAIGQGEQICAVIPSMNMVVAWMSSTWVNNYGYRVGLKVINDEFLSKINQRAVP